MFLQFLWRSSLNGEITFPRASGESSCFFIWKSFFLFFFKVKYWVLADMFAFSLFNCNVEYSCHLGGLEDIFPSQGSLLLEFTLCVITVCMYSVIHTLWTRSSQNHESWAVSLVVRVHQGGDLLWERVWSWMPERPRLNLALLLAHSVVLKPMSTQSFSFSLLSMG